MSSDPLAYPTRRPDGSATVAPCFRLVRGTPDEAEAAIRSRLQSCVAAIEERGLRYDDEFSDTPTVVAPEPDAVQVHLPVRPSSSR